MIRNLFTSIRRNEYTLGQALLLGALLFIILTVIFFATTQQSILFTY
jgi:hypothetical protein